MTNKGIAYDNGHRCYILEGRHKRFLGCVHEKPRQAIAHTFPGYVDPHRTVLTSPPTQRRGAVR